MILTEVLMLILRLSITACAFLIAFSSGLDAAEESYADPRGMAEVKEFLGSNGFGARHPSAPAELDQFGRLVGIWDAQPSMLGRDGSMKKGPPALWVWRFGLGGFVVQDLFIHSQDNLPPYLAGIDRSYLLTGLRAFDSQAGQWQVAWAANGASSSPGANLGTFTATGQGDEIVMLSDSAIGQQKVTFSEISDTSFRWMSQYSRDGGATWTTFMVIDANKRAL